MSGQSDDEYSDEVVVNMGPAGGVGGVVNGHPANEEEVEGGANGPVVDAAAEDGAFAPLLAQEAAAEAAADGGVIGPVVDNEEEGGVEGPVQEEAGGVDGPALLQGAGAAAAAVDPALAALIRMMADNGRLQTEAAQAGVARQRTADARKTLRVAGETFGRRMAGTFPGDGAHLAMAPFDLALEFLGGRVQTLQDLREGGGAAAVRDAVAASVGALLQAASSSTARPWMLGVQAVNRHLDSVVSAVEHPVDATGAKAAALVADSILAEVGLRESGWCVLPPSSFTASAGEEALAVARYTSHVRWALARSHRPLSLAGEVVRALVVRGKDSRTASAAKSEVPEMALWRSLLVGPNEGAPVRILAGPTAAFISADSWAVLFPATTKPSVSSVSEQTSSTTAHACETCWRTHVGVCFDKNRCGACRGTGHSWQKCPAPRFGPNAKASA
jgi:hypothetical protein